LFFIVAIALVILGSIMQSDRVLLQTTAAPHGILSVQLSPSFGQDTVIRAEWTKDTISKILYRDTVFVMKDTGLKFAKRQTSEDFGFIPLYGLLLALLLLHYPVRLKKTKEINRPLLSLLLVLLALSCIANALADWQVLNLLNSVSFSVPVIFYLSVLKWLIIIGLVIFLLVQLIIHGLLQRVSKGMVYVLGYLFRFRIVCLGLLVVYTFLWVVGQGQDLLLVLNAASAWGPACLLAAVTILAVLNWYLPKMYYPAVKPVNLRGYMAKELTFKGEVTNQDPQVKIARLLGVMTFLIPAVSILQAMRTFHMHYPLDTINPLVWLVGLMTLYYLGAKRDSLLKLYSGSTSYWLFWLTVALTALFLIAGAIYSGDVARPSALLFLAIDLVLLSFIFFLVTTLRREPKKLIPAFAGWPVFPFVIVPGLIALLAFFYCNINPMGVAFTDNLRCLTLPIVLSAIIFYTLIFSFLLLLGRNWHIQLISLLLIAGMFRAITVNNAFHEARLLDRKTARHYEKLEHYTQQWLLSRKGDMQQFEKEFPGKDYPVYIVNTYGGGIRASYWTALVVSVADQALKDSDRAEKIMDLNHDFQHYVFAYSGVSGGTIGASLLCASRYQVLYEKGSKVPLEQVPVDYFAKDFLTPVLVGLLGSDIWGAFSGFAVWPDRGALQERTWEKHSGASGFNYGDTLGNYWAGHRYEVPLLFANTFDVDSGRKGIAAPLRLDRHDFPGAVLVDPLITDSLKEMRLSTASFLSARFPFVSPTGKIGSQHFSDGGNVENSGAETSLQIEVVLHRVLDSLVKLDPAYKIVKIHLLSLSNDLQLPDASSVETSKNLFELTAPLTGVFNLIDGNAGKADSMNRVLSAAGKQFAYHLIKPSVPTHPVKTDGSWPVYPLGWQMSQDALLQMQQTLQDDDSVRKVIQTIRPSLTHKIK
jgi:hypothetical protein